MNKLYSRGFTLIELMIVVVILGILAAFAYSNYSRSIVESRRSDAQIGLTQLAAQEEKFFTQCNFYTASIDSGALIANGVDLDCSGLGLTTSGTAGTIFSPNQFYTLTVATAGGAKPQSYTATAAAVATKSQATDGAFNISNTGLKQWDKNNNGVFTDPGENSWRK